MTNYFNLFKILAVSGMIVLTGFKTYKSYIKYLQQAQKQSDQNKNKVLVEKKNQGEFDCYDLHKSIQQFKSNSRINFQKPSLLELKQMLKFCNLSNYQQTTRIANQFKKLRLKINRKTHPNQYFRQIASGLNKYKIISSKLQQAIFIEVGITPQIMYQYKQQIGKFLYELQRTNYGNENISLGDLKNVLRLQYNLLEQKGNNFVNQMVKYCTQWKPQQKIVIPEIFSIYVLDQISDRNPQIQSIAHKGLQKMFQKYLYQQGQKLKQLMVPLIGRLCQQTGIVSQLYEFKNGKIIYNPIGDLQTSNSVSNN